MDFTKLVGHIFTEVSLFEQIQFEVESNLDKYLGVDRHIFFERLTDGKIRVTKVVQYEDKLKLHEVSKASFGKAEWIDLDGQSKSVGIQLCRLDQSGRLAVVERDHTHVQETGLMYLDDRSKRPPLTPEEIRQGFMELAGIFDEHQALDNLRSKKAV